MITHTKNFGVYYWDTFDNITSLVNEFDTIIEAEAFVEKRYTVRSTGADKVDIVDLKGKIVRQYSVG